MPKRIQRKRTRGWRLLPNTVYVGRPTKWGNPFGKDAASLGRFRHGIELRLSVDKSALALLRGKDLACWCKEPEPGAPDLCHAAILLELCAEQESKGK